MEHLGKGWAKVRKDQSECSIQTGGAMDEKDRSEGSIWGGGGAKVGKDQS